MEEKKQVTLESIGLSVTPLEPTTKWVNQKFLMLGEPKVGKTDFWAQGGDKNFFIRTEQGHNHVKTYGANVTCLKELYDVIDKFRKASFAGILPYETVVVDTGDRLIEIIDDDVIEWGQNKYKNSEIYTVGDIPEGNGWRNRTIKMSMVLNDLTSLPCAVVFIFHVTEDQREDAGGSKYKISTINLGGKTAKAILGWADHTLHVQSVTVGDAVVRQVKVKRSKNVEAGSRGEYLKNDIKWGNNMKDNYDNFRKLFS